MRASEARSLRFARRPLREVSAATAAYRRYAARGQAKVGATLRKWPRTLYAPGGCRVTCAGRSPV